MSTVGTSITTPSSSFILHCISCKQELCRKGVSRIFTFLFLWRATGENAYKYQINEQSDTAEEHLQGDGDVNSNLV